MVSGKNGYGIYSLNQVTFRWDTYELHRDKTNKMACVPSEDSDQPGHPPGLIRVFTVHLTGSFLHADNEDSDQTVWMPRLI